MSVTAFASHVPDEKVYSETVDCGSVSQLDLFRRVRIAVSQLGPDNKTLIADKETGDFVSQGYLAINVQRTENSPGGSYQFRYVLTVESVNRKYRASITSIEFMDNGRSIPMKNFNPKAEKGLEALGNELDSRLRGILAELQLRVKDYKPF
ncbi:DUF4468 domain-containing protein [Dyadobacter arcticus]|uniref:DUF4468 domain-containing protein n=1 Tax=Dyadobacter arcticus TaxID=1078754 RepID=A0ABX0UN29_9BACT|nr:DUF4468 domain-containing protein [Dyadobacter arcticus]NIJ53863.1 hypothetical protein [Dyadobacter arcticus]